MESRTVEKVEAGAQVTYDGPMTIITGSIGQGAKIKVINGSLTIRTTVENNVQIDVANNVWEQLHGCIVGVPSVKMINNAQGCFIQRLQQLVIEGDVKENVSIAAEGNVGIEIQGSCASGSRIRITDGSIVTQDLGMTEVATPAPIEVETINGSIKVKNVGPRVQLVSTNGSITCGHVSATAIVSTTNGSIKCEYAESGARIRTTNGKINCQGADEAAEANISTVNGSVEIAGRTVKRASVASQGMFVVIQGNYVRADQQNDQEDCCGCSMQ